MKLLKKSSNSKLGRGIAAFSIPAISTCPGSTKLCRSLCYADKGFYNMPKVNKSLKDNYKASEEADFVININKEIQRFRTITAIRIHPSGDFYSNTYIDKWIDIVKDNPTVSFWAYTRSWRLPQMHAKLKALAALNNIEVFASIDESTTETPPTWLRVADLQDDWDKADNSFVKCPNQRNPNITCAKCTYCFKPQGNKINVIFKKH